MLPVIVAVVIFIAIAVAGNWERLKAKHDSLGRFQRTLIQRLLFVGMLIPTIFVMSYFLPFVGFEFNLPEQVAMAVAIAVALTASAELYKRFVGG